MPGRAPAPAVVSRRLPIRGLDEGRVWEDLAARLNLSALVPAWRPLSATRSPRCSTMPVEHSSPVLRDPPTGSGMIAFEIRDSGIGVCSTPSHQLYLADEETALIELLRSDDDHARGCRRRRRLLHLKGGGSVHPAIRSSAQMG